jgi:hypothetical protein
MTQLAAATTFIIILFLSTFSNAQAINAGARYSGQGGTSIANGNDAFMLAINPASLVTHSDHRAGEVVATISHQTSVVTDENRIEAKSSNTSVPSYYAGYYAYKMGMFGYYSHTSNTNTALTVTANGQTFNDVSLSQSGVSIGIGNMIENDETFTYALGYSVDFLNGDFNSGESKLAGEGTTISGKVSYELLVPISNHALQAKLTVAGSSSNEVAAKETAFNDFVMRPDIKRAGAMIDLSHLNRTFPWSIALSVDVMDLSASSPLLDKSYSLGRTTAFGAEWVALAAQQSSTSFSLRAGTRKNSNQAQIYFSGGLGLSYGAWSFDLSAFEDEFAYGDMSYQFSVTRTFGQG